MKLIGRRSGEAPILAVGILSLLVISALTGLTPFARGASLSPSDQSGTNGMTSSSAPSARARAPLSTATVNPVSASGSKPASDPTVVSNVSPGATGVSPERKVFYSSGYWWVFWNNYGSFYYSSSANGTFWSSPIEFSSGTSFSVWVAQGTGTVYYAASTGLAEFYYNNGTLNSPVEGQIDWGTQTTVSTVYNTTGSISVITDSLGNPWVAAYTEGGVTLEQYVEIYEMVGGTWVASSNSPIANPPPSSPKLTDGRVQLVPIPNGVSVLYSFIDCNPFLYSYCYTGLSLEYAALSGETYIWSSPVSAGADYTEFSATALGDTIYIAGSYGPGGVDFSYYTVGDTAASTPVTLASGQSWGNDAGTEVSISQGAPGSETLVLFYQEGVASIGYLVGAIAPDMSVAWGTAQSLFSATILSGISSVDTAPITSVGDDFGLIFTNYVEIFNLDFAGVTTPSITLSPAQGPVGTVVTVTGAAFSASTDIGSIEFDGATPASQTCTEQETDVTGAFTCTFTVPADAAGEQTVTVAGSDIATVSGDAASAEFAITTPMITLSPLLGPVGTSVTVTGTGFSVDTDIGSIAITGGTITKTNCIETNSTGGFTCTFTVPSDDSAGAQTVTVTGSDGGADTAFATFTVTTSSSSSLVQLSLTLNQFEDYGSPLSASNYFTVEYYASGILTSANDAGGTITLLVDPHTAVNISAVSSASNTAEQWCLSATSDGTCQPTGIPVGTSDLSATYVYYDLQVQFVNYEITGGGDPVAPIFGLYATAPLAPLSYGAPYSATVNPLSEGYTTIWVIAGTLENFQPTANTSPPTDFQQWQGVPDCDVLYVGSISCGALVSSDSIGPFSQGGVFVTIDYYHQYEELPQYQISPGSDQGTGYTGPTLTYYSAGVLSKQLLALDSPVEVWVDAGTGWSVDSILGGSYSSEQWICISDCSGTVPGAIGAPLDIYPVYSHQYLVVFNAALYYGCTGSGYPPLSPLNTCIGLGQPTDLWTPAGQPYTLSAVVYVGTGFIGWTSCASWYAIDELPGDSGCSASEVTIVYSGPGGLGTEVGNSWETQITPNGPGTVYADYVFQATGSTVTCTGGSANCQYFHESYGTEGKGDPVYVLITGPYGTGQVGCNDTGGAVETMALAFVSSCGGSTESIVIANPIINGMYEVNIFPDGGTGAFNITMTTENSVGDVTGTPLFTSGTCTPAGGCTPFNVTVGSDGILSFSSSTVPTGVPQFPVSILALVPALLLALVYLRRRNWPRSR